MVFRDYDKDALIQWYNEHSSDYDKECFTQDEKNYGGDLYRIEIVSQLLKKYRRKNVLDIGCGTAEPMLHLLKQGYKMQGFDLSPGMVDQAKSKLKRNGFDAGLVDVGDLLSDETMSRYRGREFDCVITNGVLPYIKDIPRAHKNVSDIMAPGSIYIGAYSNCLMDLFTFNRFTARFFKDSFIAPLNTSDEMKAKIYDAVCSLMTHPDLPKRIENSARNEIYVESNNPLTIGDELKGFNLQMKEILFYKFHAFPPLVAMQFPELAPMLINLSREYEVERANDWRGHFLASTFIVVAEKS